jgi:hypothetical protein
MSVTHVRTPLQNTRMVLVAHIFGTLLPLDNVLEVARANDLLVVEDCAQAFAGRTHYMGDARADVSMFSFGTIKTATSFGGGLLRVNDTAVLDEMKRRERRWGLLTLSYRAERLLIVLCERERTADTRAAQTCSSSRGLSSTGSSTAYQRPPSTDSSSTRAEPWVVSSSLYVLMWEYALGTY